MTPIVNHGARLSFLSGGGYQYLKGDGTTATYDLANSFCCNGGSYGLAIGSVPSKRVPDVAERITERFVSGRFYGLLKHRAF